MIHTVAPQRSAGEAWTPPGIDHLPGPISWEPLPDSVAEELPIFLVVFAIPVVVALFIWWKFS